METIKEFVMAEAVEIIMVIIATILSLIAASVRKAINRICDTKTEKEIALTAVNAVEQIFTDLHGEEKLTAAVRYLQDTLLDKGVYVTNDRCKYLIESAVHEMNQLKVDLGEIELSTLESTTDETDSVATVTTYDINSGEIIPTE